MILIVFPDQLYLHHPGLERKPDKIVLIEDSLYFGDRRYPLLMHKQKLWLHRASMQRFRRFLLDQNFDIEYVEYDSSQRLTLGEQLKMLNLVDQELVVAQPSDFILEKRLRRFAESNSNQLRFLPDPGFINDSNLNQEYRRGKKRWFMADFYKWQRKRLDILMEGDKPAGGKWSFDAENRKKIPKKLLTAIPELRFAKIDAIDRDARKHVEDQFPDNPGSLQTLIYPTSHEGAGEWLGRFLEQRFDRFGEYEDAIAEGESWLWHSVLTPMLNIGLLTPDQVVDAVLKHANEKEVPLNSLEGFIRQVIGWREFMRATYEDLGVKMRTTNHWNHRRKIPDSFYNGSTGIDPIDDVIRRVLQTGYCHHIERLMVLGGFMFLCQFDPDEIYNWFMEMFVDSFDWVMVPNVYAMSQHADGGGITTKPYFSGSAYIRKMSHYKPGRWSEVWDGLYWRWILNHVDELAKNPRWAMMCSTARKMDVEKKKLHMENAESFLSSLKGS